MINEEWKSRLRDYARGSVEYPIREEKEKEEGQTWTFEVRSECPYAFHDESRWDNTQIIVSDRPPSADRDYRPMEIDGQLRGHLEQLLGGSPYKCSAFIKRINTSSWDYETFSKTVLSPENPDDPSCPGWILITGNWGRF